MRQKQKQNHGIMKLALSLVIATSPMVANVLFNLPVYAESENSTSNFTLPKTMEKGTVINIDGSVNFVIVNQKLKETFEEMFSGTQVKIGVNGNEDAVKSLINGTVDLATLGRKLTLEEQAQGLEQLFVRREKIAIIVGVKNPFNGNLTTEQFAKIFRGEITDWSELGGEKKPIRFIDRPSNSDTRSSFQEYEIFKKGEFKTGNNSTQVTDDSTAEIIKQLGDDGISYALVNQLSKLQDVKTIKVQDFTPDKPNYPFSQSFVYVYKQNPDSKVAGFLGFIAAKPGQESIEAARQAEALAIATSTLQNFTITTTGSQVNTTPLANTKVEQKTLVVSSQKQETSTTEESNNSQSFINNFTSKENARLVLLLPMILVPGIGSLIYLWLTRKKKVADEANSQIQASQLEALTISESNVNLTNNNYTSLNGTNYHQENNKTAVLTPEADINFNQNNTNGNLAVIELPIDLPQPESISTETEELLWDIEAPVVVVNSHYPQIPNIGKNSDNFNISPDDLIISDSSEIAAELSDQTENKEEQRVNNLSELLGVQSTSNHQNGSLSLSELLGMKPTSEAKSDFPETLHEALNNIVEETEIITHQPEKIEDLQTGFNTVVETEIKPNTSTEELQNQEISDFNFSSNTRIIFTPRTPKWAYVSWYIDNDHKQSLLNQGITNLAVRLYDVTHLDLSYQTPQLVQQYNCEDAVYDCYVFIPTGERDYITEIGYAAKNNHWLCLARSGIVRVFSRPSTDFWLVVDTELVIHGATEQGSSVTIDGQKVKLNDDGTFKLTVPFVDNLVDYHITATKADSNETKTIQKRFSQEEKEI